MAQRLACQHGGEPNPLDTTGLCLLSLDGGGVRGLSTLYILKSIMDRLNDERKKNNQPPVKPCEVFDLIGGTNTGGLIAIMLGRLEMSVDECITAYSDLAAAVFVEKLSRIPLTIKGQVKSRFDSTRLESELEKVITQSGASATALLNDGTEHGCRTFVCTINRNTKDMVRLRSYNLPGLTDIQATICQAALATSAAPTFFDPVSINGRTFADGGFGANNPVEEVEAEAYNIWGSGERDLKELVKCFISIGTGNPGKKAFERSMVNFLSKTVVQIATETEATETRFIEKWAKHYDNNRYFRLNVDQGLQDIGLDEYKKKGHIIAATDGYLNHVVQRFRVRDCIQNLRLKENRPPTAFASVIKEYETRCILRSQTTVRKTFWNVPLPINRQFVGRDYYLDHLESALFTEHGPPKTAITGLGGVGKTQIVLELAYRTRENHQECSMFWLPATNVESLRQAFTDIGQQLAIPRIKEEQADIKELVQRYLSQESAGHWLLIVDNIDDMNIWNTELKAYLPRSQRGCVACTTRSRKAAVKIAASNVIEVPQMDEEMGKQLLAKSLINQELLNNRQDALELLRQLTFLPLAIVQAAAYINKNGIVLADYLSLLQEQEQDVIELLSEDFEDEGRYKDVKNPVATTWLISFEQIQQDDPLAAEYLSFMACVNPSRKKETDAIGTLTAYSFVSRRVADNALDIHRLVHLAMRNWLKKKEQWLVWTNKAMERLHEFVPYGGHDKREVWKPCLPHAHHIMGCTAGEKQSKMRTELLAKLARCLRSEGRYNEASDAFSNLVEILKQALGADHPDTLANMHNLADAYNDQGRWKEAETLYLYVLEVETRVLGNDAVSLLTTRSNLALTYWNQQRWKEAEELHIQVLEAEKRVLGEEHRDTLISMGNLALTYTRQGQLKKAEELEVQVVEARKRVLREEHPDTLVSIGNLASTYNKQGKWKEAEELCVQVIDRQKRVLGEEHPDTLFSMGNLASTYYKQGK